MAGHVVLVTNQLNMRTSAALYPAFPPAEAKRLADRLKIHHTLSTAMAPRPDDRDLTASGRSERPVIERTLTELTRFRRIATRDDTLAGDGDHCQGARGSRFADRP